MNPLVSLELQHEIEQFLFYEASLLDDGKYDQWLDLFTDDLEYFVPIRETLDNPEQGVGDNNRIVMMNDNKTSLQIRIARLGTGMAHAETPPTRTRHSISNIMISGNNDEYQVRCNFHISATRLEKMEFSYYGYRLDTIQRSDKQLTISKRKVILDQTLLPRAISIFF